MVNDLHITALVFYALTGVLAVAPLIRPPSAPPAPVLTLAISALAVTVHFAGLLVYARTTGSLPLSGIAPALSSLSFLVGLLALAIQWLTRERAIALVAAPLVVALLVTALSTGFSPAPGNLTVADRGMWFLIHAGASLLGLALLAVAFAASALYVLQHRQLKDRRFGAIFQFLPPLEQLDQLNRLALVVGFPVLTLGIALALGYLGLGSQAAAVGAGHLGWGLVSWAVLGAVLGLRITGRLHGRRAALGSILAFAAIASGYLFLMLVDATQGRFF